MVAGWRSGTLLGTLSTCQRVPHERTSCEYERCWSEGGDPLHILEHLNPDRHAASASSSSGGMSTAAGLSTVLLPVKGSPSLVGVLRYGDEAV